MDIHAYTQGRWRLAAQVTLLDPQQVSRHAAVRVQYDADYARNHRGARDYRALSVHLPVDLATRNIPHWPPFLVDLLPQGAAHKRLERLSDGPLSEWSLLQRGANNPVGNLRIGSGGDARPVSHPGFDLSEMLERGDAFVDFASGLGAAVAGATDTQGEAPKFWVVEDKDGRWHPDDGNISGDGTIAVRRHMLLKFPVPEAGPKATDILRNEAAYQKVARRLGLRVTAALPEFVNGGLLIPRFDRRLEGGREVRLGVESLYSVSGVLDSAQSALRHHEVLIALAACVSDFKSELVEYLKRDVLNLALGNRDNHGRNSAVLKDTDGTIRLSPLYDFGPSFLDARAIARVIRWEGEEPGAIRWQHVTDNLKTRFDEAGIALPDWRIVTRTLKQMGKALPALPGIMSDCGVDPPIVERRMADIARLGRELSELKGS